MELPRIGAKVEGMVLSTLCDPAVHCGEHGPQIDGFSVGENWPDGLSADGHVSNGWSRHESSVDLHWPRSLTICQVDNHSRLELMTRFERLDYMCTVNIKIGKGTLKSQALNTIIQDKHKRD